MGKSVAQVKGILLVDYYKTQWHNCNRCRIHYMSEHPHLKAYLCDECWTLLPHFKVGKLQKKKILKKKTGITWKTIALYTIADVICLGIIAYYLWFK